MAQAKRKRRTKHRGTQAGTIEARGRTSRPTSRADARQRAQQRQSGKVERAVRPPSWRGATIRAGVAAVVFLGILIVMKQPIASALAVGLLMFGLYIPMGYYTDVFLYNRRIRKDAEAKVRADAAKAEAKAKAKAEPAE